LTDSIGVVKKLSSLNKYETAVNHKKGSIFMAEESTTYEQKAQRLSALRQELAKAEQGLKSKRRAALKFRKEATSNPKCDAIINRFSIYGGGCGIASDIP
jgi:Mg2+ and Co2+ transporter CorA